MRRDGLPLRYALASWIRLHVVLMLELNGQFGGHLPPTALLSDAEVEALERDLAAMRSAGRADDASTAG